MQNILRHVFTFFALTSPFVACSAQVDPTASESESDEEVALQEDAVTRPNINGPGGWTPYLRQRWTGGGCIKGLGVSNPTCTPQQLGRAFCNFDVDREGCIDPNGPRCEAGSINGRPFYGYAAMFCMNAPALLQAVEVRDGRNIPRNLCLTKRGALLTIAACNRQDANQQWTMAPFWGLTVESGGAVMLAPNGRGLFVQQGAPGSVSGTPADFNLSWGYLRLNRTAATCATIQAGKVVATPCGQAPYRWKMLDL
jgi:hypothetical protein